MIGFFSIGSCIAGAITSGMSVPSEVQIRVETESSAIPAANLESAFAVQGATSTASTLLEVTSPRRVPPVL